MPSWLLTMLFLFLTHIFVSVLLATNEPRPRVVVSGRVRLLWVHISLHNILTSSCAHLAPGTGHWSGPRYRWLGLGSSHFSQWFLVTNIWQRYSNCNDEKINLEKYSELYLSLLSLLPLNIRAYEDVHIAADHILATPTHFLWWSQSRNSRHNISPLQWIGGCGLCNRETQ